MVEPADLTEASFSTDNLSVLLSDCGPSFGGEVIVSFVGWMQNSNIRLEAFRDEAGDPNAARIPGMDASAVST